MKIALVGGTHGNEPVGIEVVRLFEQSNKKYKNDFQSFWANTKACELKKRYVDCDLNRAFGKNGVRHGYEKQRAGELKSEIKSKFDFCIDLHTTTSNMGLTAILNNTHISSQNAAASLYENIKGLKLIEEDHLDEECRHLNRLCPGGLTIEVGPVANNVINGDLVSATFKIVEHILDFDFEKTIDLSNIEYFKMLGQVNYPEGQGWYISSNLEGKDFEELKPGTPIFTNIQEDQLLFEESESRYPFFINEAAYLENKSAFLLAEKRVGLARK